MLEPGFGLTFHDLYSCAGLRRVDTAFGAWIEHADAVALILTEEGAVLRVRADSARARIRRGRFEPGNIAGFGVNLSDIVRRKVREVQIVVRIGIDPVDRAAAAVRQFVHGREVLVIAGLDV